MLEECKPWSTKRTRSKSVSVQCCNTNLCNKPVGTKVGFNSTSCAMAHECENWSISTGCWRKEYSALCCDTNNCNNRVAPETLSHQSVAKKGCASKSACERELERIAGPYGNVTCCEGNLCNGAQSVTQSFLFLCCSVLSFILLH
ncbi:urokinase plasminogen activator surface receptor-like protein [Labeo rohita]|uniref:Urokinase plasminogen activator surface receptor-like protein n=1 Tax=Labeo rohita TaxID=84645 RepID=A0A498NQ74_LABRO|nr:urokinase plasminogen activator surface receptor-like protein [Labeo rohita]